MPEFDDYFMLAWTVSFDLTVMISETATIQWRLLLTQINFDPSID